MHPSSFSRAVSWFLAVSLASLLWRTTSAQIGYISQYAGSSSGACGFSGDGGPAVISGGVFNSLTGIAFDSSDNLLVSDYQNNRLRRVDRVTGFISTVAGGGSNSADGIQATIASIGQPLGVATDPSGNIYYTEIYAGKVRMVSSSGIISTLVTGLLTPAPIVFHSGLVYFGETQTNQVKTVDPFSLSVTVVANTGWPNGIAFDNAGNMYVTNDAGTLSTFFTNGTVSSLTIGSSIGRGR